MDGVANLQDSCLRIIDRHAKREGRAPARRELAELLADKSTHGVNQILAALAKKGYVSIEPPGKARNVRVLRVPPRQLSLVRAPDTRRCRRKPR